MLAPLYMCVYQQNPQKIGHSEDHHKKTTQINVRDVNVRTCAVA